MAFHKVALLSDFEALTAMMFRVLCRVKKKKKTSLEVRWHLQHILADRTLEPGRLVNQSAESLD